MDRIPLYTDIENLAEIFGMDRSSDVFHGIKQLISRESEIIFCDEEIETCKHELFPHIAKELTSGHFIVKFRHSDEDFLVHPFKTNLQERFTNKSSILFSHNNVRVTEFRPKNGLLMAGKGEETMIYNRLNFNREIFKAFTFLIPGKSLTDYTCFEPLMLPFSEIIINEPYLFLPDHDDWNLEGYMKYNFVPLMKSLFRQVKNKTNIIICTFVNDNERVKLKFPYYNMQRQQDGKKGFAPLYEFCNTFFKEMLGGARFNLWLVVSPMARKARHDRYILTNYQYIESGSGFAFFDDKGRFENRGEKVEFFSIMEDEARKELIPSVLQKLQEISIDQTLAFDSNRVFGTDQGDSFFLKFSK